MNPITTLASAAPAEPIPDSLAACVDSPGRVFEMDRGALDRLPRRELDAFRLEAARRLASRQAQRIPAVAEMREDADPADFTAFDDFLPLLFDADVYKGYDPRWLLDHDFAALTRWIARFTANDYSEIDMSGCDSLTEWCRRIEEQTGDLICHSSGTSGTLSFVPRSPRDVDRFADALMWNFQSQAFGARRRFLPGKPNDIVFFAPLPRRQYRITAGIVAGVERRYETPPAQLFELFLGPEFAIAQGKLRTAARRGGMEAARSDPIVAAHEGEVAAYEALLPDRLQAWIRNLVDHYRGRRILFQGSFDMAWQVAQHFRAEGISGAFAPDSVFAVIGGVKDGSTLPADWKEQFRDALGVDESSFSLGWGMSEINGGVRQCPHRKFHFPPHLIPFLLDPPTRIPLPRRGVQRGRFAMLELVSEDNWGGMMSGDAATIDWDGECGCGRPGPLMEPSTITRI